jgi:putative ABC transport system permease protein
MNNFRLALRHLGRHKVFSLINIGGLAASLASCVFIFYFVYDEFSYDRFHANAGRIYRITQVFKTKEDTQNLLWTHQKLGPYLKRVYPQIEEFVRIEDTEAVFGKTGKEREGIVKVDPSVFNVFTYPLLEGNPNTALGNLNTIVISESLARKYFHGVAMGQTVEIDGQPYEVTGVMKDVPKNSDKWVNALARGGDFGGEEDADLGFVYQTYILLKEGEDPEFIRSQLSNTAEVLHRKSTGDLQFGYDIQALTDLHFFTGTGMDNPKGNESNTKMLAVVACVLLIVALFNFINLTTVMSLERAKEVGVRKVAGAQKGQLVKQFISESAVAVFIAAFFAIAFIGIMNSMFTAVSGKQIYNLYLVGGISILLLFAAVASAIYPAWVLSSYRPVKALKNELEGASTSGILRKILTTVQFALSTALLIFLATVLFQTDFMRTSDPGFNKDKVVVFQMPNDSASMAHTGFFIEEFRKISSVSDVGIGGFASTPGTPDVTASPIRINVNGEQKDPIVSNTTADAHYTAILGLNAVEGKSFHDLEGQNVEGKAIVNQSFARLAGWNNPIGEKIHTYSGDAEIIGIIPDFHFKSLHSKIEPLVIMGRWTNSTEPHSLFVKITTNNMDELRAAWHRILPDQPFEYHFLNDYFDKQYQAEVTLQTIFLYFTMLTIIIAASGLFGLTIHHVQKKTREISIRKVLGAEISSLIRLLSKEFFYLTIAGVLLGGIGGNVIANRWLSRFAYHIDPGFNTVILPVIFIVAISLMILVYRTYRASTGNPVKGLRVEN